MDTTNKKISNKAIMPAGKQHIHTIHKTIASAEPFKVDFNFNIIGGYMPNAEASLNELIQNAIGAIEAMVLINPLFHGVVRIWTELRHDGVHLCVANNGIEGDLKRMMDYGFSQKSVVHFQYGSGLKNATLNLCDPTIPGAVKIYLCRSGIWEKTEFPYGTEMNRMPCTMEEMDRIPSDCITCIDILLKNPNALDGTSIEDLGYRYAPAIQNLRLDIVYEGKVVEAVSPSGSLVSRISNSAIPKIPGAYIDVDVYNACDADPDDHFFPKAEGRQGVHCYVNNVFVTYLGMSRFYKANSRTEFIGNHETLNAIQIIVNIHTPADRSADMPMTNNKTAIDWNHESGLGHAYTDAMNDVHIGYTNDAYQFCVNKTDVNGASYPIATTLAQYVRIARKAQSEAGKRDNLIRVLKMFEKDLYHVIKECSVSAADVPANQRSREEIVLVKEKLSNGKPDMRTAAYVVEMKLGVINNARLNSAFLYCDLLRMNYNADPIIRVIGAGIQEEAARLAEFKVKTCGYKLECFESENLTKIWPCG